MPKENLARTLISFCIPLVFSGLLQQMYSWTDAFIVGNIEGEAALAAIASSNALTNLFLTAITGFTSGVSILAARRFGKQDLAAQSKILSTFSVVLGLVFTLISLIGLSFANGMMRLLHVPSEIFHSSKNYLQIILIGIPFLTIYNVYAAVLRGIGDSKTPFYAILVSSIANILLDMLMVGFFRWHVEGAAIATILSQILMTLFIVFYAIKRHPSMRFCFSRTMIDSAILKEGCSLALPITIQSMITSAGNLILQNFMNSFGTSTVAAITTAYRIDRVIMLPVVNLGTGIATITAQKVGARDNKRARQCLYVGLLLTAVTSICFTALVLCAGGPLIGLFGVEPASVEIGRTFFNALASFYSVFGVSMAMRGYIEGTGNVFFSGIYGILALIVRILLSYALKPLFNQVVIAYAEGFSWCFQSILYAAFIFLFRKKRPLHQK